METVRNFFNDESGASAVEYGLLVSLIAVAIIGAVTALGGKLSDLFTGVSAKVVAPS
jgi:pilus assembly protein Flp/PilA